MRGKVCKSYAETASGRITPAYAGKSCFQIVFVWHVWDHPRVCGEKIRKFKQLRTEQGSPPRMRGKVRWLSGLSGTPGITPAYAGKRSSPWGEHGCNGDHPRVCGEKFFSFTVVCRPAGSPPRMRGKGESACTGPCLPGITPAYAGKSPCGTRKGWSQKDHPRVCGEKVWRTSSGTCSRGSPPRMRGKVLLRILRVSGMGITPAYAGKSEGCEGQDCSKQDHPRVCGEKHIVGGLLVFLQGSPPRMRGKVFEDFHNSGGVRITPAYAGKRTRWRAGQTYYKDHPRVCGEKLRDWYGPLL